MMAEEKQVMHSEFMFKAMDAVRPSYIALLNAVPERLPGESVKDSYVRVGAKVCELRSWYADECALVADEMMRANNARNFTSD